MYSGFHAICFAAYVENFGVSRDALEKLVFDLNLAFNAVMSDAGLLSKSIFPQGPSTLCKKNENLDIKTIDNEYSFNLNGVLYSTSEDPNNIKRRITLQHKVTGEVIHLYDTDPITFTPKIEKLRAKESGSNLGTNYAELTRNYGSVKAQKQLREKEKLNINKEAQKVIREAHRETLKEEKLEAAKGNKLDKTYIDCDLDESISGSNLTNLINEDKKIKLSSIAPKEVLDSLKPEAESVVGLTYEQIENLKSSLSFHPSILELIRKWSTYDLRRMQLAILLEYMIRFLSLSIKSVRTKEPLIGCPLITTRFIILNFTKEILNDSGKPTIQINREEKDKLYLMIIALFGYLSNYEFPISRFMVDTKGGRDRIRKLGQLINVRIAMINKEHVMKSLRPYIIEDL